MKILGHPGPEYDKGVKTMRLSRQNIIGLGLVGLMGLTLAGCGHLHWPRLGKADRTSGLRIIPKDSRYGLTRLLKADDIVTMMLHVGFSEKQTFELGENLRDALASAGAAEVRRGKEVQAIFAVYENDCIFITVRTGATYIYEVRKGRFGLGQGAGPSRGP